MSSMLPDLSACQEDLGTLFISHTTATSDIDVHPSDSITGQSRKCWGCYQPVCLQIGSRCGLTVWYLPEFSHSEWSKVTPSLCPGTHLHHHNVGSSCYWGWKGHIPKECWDGLHMAFLGKPLTPLCDSSVHYQPCGTPLRLSGPRSSVVSPHCREWCH